jgi:hypothetical protein
MIERAIKRFFTSDEGQACIEKAINAAFQREITFERTDAEGVKEHVKETHNLLDVLAAWLKNTEGALRGCQADAASARNRATETRDMILQIPGEIHRLTTCKEMLLIEAQDDKDA